jgi:hypothetical protein
MAALYCFDEYTDQGDEVFVRQAADIVKDALRNPFKFRPEGEIPIGEVFRQWVISSPHLSTHPHPEYSGSWHERFPSPMYRFNSL